MGCIVLFQIIGGVQFIANALFAIIVTYYSLQPNDKCVGISLLKLLRQYTIVIYFTHFFYQWLFCQFVGYGFENFVFSLLCAVITAVIIVKMSGKVKLFKYLY